MIFSEHRLLGYTLAQINEQRKKAGASQVTGKPTRQVTGTTVNPDTGATYTNTVSAAQANATAQQANTNRNTQSYQYQSYIDQNTGRDTRFGYDASGNVIRDESGQPIQQVDAQGNPIGTLGTYSTTPTSQGGAASPYTAQATTSTTPSTFTNPTTGQVYTGAAAARGATRFGKLQGDYAAKEADVRNLKGYDQIPQYDENGNFTGYSYQENPQKTAEMQQSALDRLQAQVESDRAMSEQERKNTQSTTLQGLPEDLQNAYQPTIDAASGAASAAGTEYAITKQEMAAEAKSAEEQKAAEEDSALTAYEDRQDFNAKIDDLQRARTEESQRRMLAENETAEEITKLENQRAERLLRDQNIKQELLNRRTAAKLGINHDTGGLQWMQEEARKGEETLSFLIQRNALTTKQFSDQRIDIINAYNLDMRQVDLDALSRYDDAYRSYQSEKSAIRKDYLAGEKDRRTALRDARQRYFDKVTESDYTKAEAYRDARLKMMDMNDEAEERQLERENMQLAFLTKQDAAQERNEDQSRSSMFMEMNRLNTRLNNDPILKPYQEQKMKFATIDADYQRTMDNIQKYKNGEIDKPTMNLIDQALINGINKMWDESSVVRESEYARTPAGMSMKNRLESWVSNKLNGGVMNDTERAAVKDAMDTMFGVWTSAADTALNKFYLQINKTNSTLMPQHWLAPEDFGLESITGTGTRYDDMFDTLTIQQMLEGDFDGGGGGFLPEVGGTLHSPAVSGIITGYGSKKSAAGVDIAAPKGTPVKAHVGGTVVKVVDSFRESFPNDDAKGRAQNGGYGNQVVMEFDNGYTGLFSHLDRTAVTEMEGKRIEAGTVLGFIGNTGNTYGKTGIHLDFELRDKNGKKLTPQQAAQFLLSSTV
jgi:murein DD-endopeptidase MepM/ murein hydrolase activator NlpD